MLNRRQPPGAGARETRTYGAWTRDARDAEYTEYRRTDMVVQRSGLSGSTPIAQYAIRTSDGADAARPARTRLKRRPECVGGGAAVAGAKARRGGRGTGGRCGLS